ncbi:hypothetical protein BU24DRAFT_494248 [Aaosphaeria arxii CBS 175.79]|uniref:Uncharacterized protein n=1 Tax=Aaosphaeria arxii CBS 175.79 TaxID=1450172 RepID=A0A6A5XKP7_9PLEO|nr:uncharacterized protein BU24DRAFT_494248 [Aaosphaeria arxii CBS 175.79]KAF2013858.1 hypothetical protein BU24DRAFT_494248 [Aaosphaeria arxii CBS 175.79]
MGRQLSFNIGSIEAEGASDKCVSSGRATALVALFEAMTRILLGAESNKRPMIYTYTRSSRPMEGHQGLQPAAPGIAARFPGSTRPQMAPELCLYAWHCLASVHTRNKYMELQEERRLMERDWVPGIRAQCHVETVLARRSHAPPKRLGFDLSSYHPMYAIWMSF